MTVAGTVRVPGDKSISHRALILSAIAIGESRITGILESADVSSTARVLRALGVDVPPLSGDFIVRGVGRRGLRHPSRVLDCGNSGTTTRLMAGVVAATPIDATFVGDASLSRRPMRRIARPLEAMGARVELPPHGGLPMTVRGGQLHHVEWSSEAASAQIKSAVLLAAVVGGVSAAVIEPSRSRDHTERMLAARGAQLVCRGTRVEIAAGPELAPLDVDIPGDPSSAAFFAALASLADGGQLRLARVCVNDTRIGFLRHLEHMGGRISTIGLREEGGESVADIVVTPARLEAARVDDSEIATMIDELPLLACLATQAHGETVITGAAELRVKESDRISAVVSNLRAIGANAEELSDGLRVGGPTRRLAGKITTHGDHRLAMAFGVLGALPNNEIEIDDRDCVAVSYPEFWNDLARIRAS
jgi:3-phosphoshikimate 1-carboxyvinyltransferase